MHGLLWWRHEREDEREKRVCHKWRSTVRLIAKLNSLGREDRLQYRGLSSRSCDTGKEGSWQSAEYEEGFASKGELWLGLRKIQQLTTEGDYSLHVILKDFDNKTYQAVYDHFEVGQGDEYEFKVEWYNHKLSSLGDSLTQYHNGMKFSAKDKDQDSWHPGYAQYQCAPKKKGGGWFSNCGRVHLTGVLTSISERLPDERQIYWYDGGDRSPRDTWNSWKEVEMKLVEEAWARKSSQ